MIGTIVIGRGNNRVVVERERNFAMSQWAADGIRRRVGIAAPKGQWRRGKR